MHSIAARGDPARVSSAGWRSRIHSIHLLRDYTNNGTPFSSSL
jgi:hypothetical protein